MQARPGSFSFSLCLSNEISKIHPRCEVKTKTRRWKLRRGMRFKSSWVELDFADFCGEVVRFKWVIEKRRVSDTNLSSKLVTAFLTRLEPLGADRVESAGGDAKSTNADNLDSWDRDRANRNFLRCPISTSELLTHTHAHSSSRWI